jgi:hypothetical protein
MSLDAPVIINPLQRRSAANTIFDTNELILPNDTVNGKEVPAFRWELVGIRFNTDLCSDPCLVASEVCEDEVDMPAPHSFGQATFMPWRAQFAVSCNAAQLTDAGEQAKFFEAVSNTNNGFIHKALASGAWNGGSTWTGLSAPVATATTDGPTVVTGGPTHVRAVLGILIQGVSSKGSGSEAVIHMSPYVANMAVADGLIYRNGNRLRTVVGDHLIVADGGYSGAGPGVPATGSSQWIYATGPFFHKVGTSRFVPGWGNAVGSKDLTDYINRHANRLYVPVETSMIAAWDPCLWLAGEIDLSPNPCCS